LQHYEIKLSAESMHIRQAEEGKAIKKQTNKTKNNNKNELLIIWFCYL